MNFFRDLIQSVKKTNPEDFDKYDEEYYEEQQASSYNGRPRSSYGSVQSHQSSYQTSQHDSHISERYGSSTYIEGREDSKRLRIERPEGSKVVPLKTTDHGLEVCIMKCNSFDESQDICDVILSNCCAIVTLSGIDLALAQRIMDFVSGSVYSLNGKLYQIHDCIFFIAPGNVDVSGDYNDILEQTGYNLSLLK